MGWIRFFFLTGSESVDDTQVDVGSSDNVLPRVSRLTASPTCSVSVASRFRFAGVNRFSVCINVGGESRTTRFDTNVGVTRVLARFVGGASNTAACPASQGGICGSCSGVTMGLRTAGARTVVVALVVMMMLSFELRLFPILSDISGAVVTTTGGGGL